MGKILATESASCLTAHDKFLVFLILFYFILFCFIVTFGFTDYSFFFLFLISPDSKLRSPLTFRHSERMMVTSLSWISLEMKSNGSRSTV